MTYLSIFAIRKRSGKDARSWKVFWLDLMKMGIGQGCAWGINVINSHRNSEMAAEEGSTFDAVSWYFPTFLNDELIAVPLGVLLWHQGILRLAGLTLSFVVFDRNKGKVSTRVELGCEMSVLSLILYCLLTLRIECREAQITRRLRGP